MSFVAVTKASPVLIISFFSALVTYGQGSKPQIKPNLSGMWALDRSSSKVSKSLSGADETVEITHAEPELKIRRYVTVNGQMSEKELVYFTDGRGETNPATTWLASNPDPRAPHPKETKSKTKWSGERIVTRATLRMNVGIHVIAEDVVDEWTLSADGKTLTRTTKFYMQRNASPDAVLVTAHHPDDKRVYNLVSK